MNYFETWKKRRSGALTKKTISLLNLDPELASKATQIDAEYMQNVESEQVTTQWELVESAITNLRDITEISNLAHLKQELQPKLEAIINAFDIETGTFPDGFNPETGKYQ